MARPNFSMAMELPPSQSLVVKHARQMQYLPNYIDAALKKLYPELGGKGTDFDRMELCVSEIAQNAVERQSRLPAWIYLEKREGALYCMVRQSEPFENPKVGEIDLPEWSAERGRGRPIVYSCTEGNLWFNGEAGETSFELALGEKRAAVEQLSWKNSR